MLVGLGGSDVAGEAARAWPRKSTQVIRRTADARSSAVVPGPQAMSIDFGALVVIADSIARPDREKASRIVAGRSPRSLRRPGSMAREMPADRRASRCSLAVARSSRSPRAAYIERLAQRTGATFRQAVTSALLSVSLVRRREHHPRPALPPPAARYRREDRRLGIRQHFLLLAGQLDDGSVGIRQRGKRCGCAPGNRPFRSGISPRLPASGAPCGAYRLHSSTSIHEHQASCRCGT